VANAPVEFVAMFKVISNKVLNDVKTENALKILAKPKRPKKEIFQLWLKDKVKNFCSVTSLHGYVHTTKEEYHAFERWLWIILSFFALITAVILLWISWNWTAETPTTTVIESTNYPTYNLPFPSVTICNMNKISKLALAEIVKEMWVDCLALSLSDLSQFRLNRKRPENMTDDEVSMKLRLLLHFRGNGNATDKEYQELSDVG
jgi:amiloride-sensitive sodium channel